MIVVFVVDTSPSMGLPLRALEKTNGESWVGMSRLDLAKMFVEDMSRKLVRKRQAHLRALQQIPPGIDSGGDAAVKKQVLLENQRSYRNLGLLGASLTTVSFLLLSTSRHSPETALCAVGGRLLVGYGNSMNPVDDNKNTTATPFPVAGATASTETEESVHQQQQQQESFQRALKSLQAFAWKQSSNTPFPDQAGGSVGLNAALSAGLQLLSRYRYQSRWTENFGMGRLPATSMLVSSSSSSHSSTQANSSTTTSLISVNGLQPACLVLLTDGACLSQPSNLGGGKLQLQFGKNAPLKDLYSEPFRWDHRVFCLNIDGGSFSHDLRALCEVTGGSFWNLSKHSQLSHVTDQLLQCLCPPTPSNLPLPDPLYPRLPPILPTATVHANNPHPGYPMGTRTLSPADDVSFANGGPIVSLQCLESDTDSSGTSAAPKLHRAMLLYAGSTASTVYYDDLTDSGPSGVLSPPLFCIPEAHFPSKKEETLPPRRAQPMLLYSKYPANLGSRSFEPTQLIKMLYRLDETCAAIRNIHTKADGAGGGTNASSTGSTRFLHRDVYICEWLGVEGSRPAKVAVKSSTSEYFPVFVQGAGRPTLTEDSDNYLHIGILHIPAAGSASLASSASTSRLATLTLLPPDPHVLLPLLIRVIEKEHQLLKKMEATGTLKGKAKTNVPLDDAWRSEFRAYLFRVPAYYHSSLRWTLRSFLPTSILPGSESLEITMKQCYSTACVQKIRNGEQVARDNNERLERQEASLRATKAREVLTSKTSGAGFRSLRYGQYDMRTTFDSYLSALRNMPPPWKFHRTEQASSASKAKEEKDSNEPQTALDLLGDLPASGLLAYYESRRRWLFGGTGMTTRGIHVEGVNYDGANSQRCKTFPKEREDSALTLGQVGASIVNECTVAKMGDYRQALLFSKAPVVGYGSNDCTGVATTTAVDGSPCWSVDDHAMPTFFFDPASGEFTDNMHTRVRARLMVNFGNPYREKRADSLIPEKYLKEAPSSRYHRAADGTPPGSPPHESFDSVEEDEAIFVRKSPSRTSPRREEPEDEVEMPSAAGEPTKRQRVDSIDNGASRQSIAKPPPPPPPYSEHKKNSSAVSLPHATLRKTGNPPPPPKGTVPLPLPPARRPSSSGNPPPPKGAVPKPLPPVRRPSGSGNPPPPPPPKAPRPPPPQGSLKRQRSESSVTSVSTSVSSTSVGPTPSSPTSQELQRSDLKPAVNLPPGWMCVWSKSQKRWYFFNTKNNKSVWQWPPPPGA